MLQKKVIRIIYWLWERKLQTFHQKFPEELSERHFTYPKDEFYEKKIWKYIVLWLSRTPRKTFLDFIRRVFRRIVIDAFYSPKGSFREKFLFEICASHWRISSDNRCGFIAQNFSIGLSNLNPKCPDHPFSEKNLLDFLAISLFLDCEQ